MPAPSEPIEIRTLTVGKRRYTLEVAATRARQKQGLGGRNALPPDAGMLFAFRSVAQRRVWMKDTYVPLDIIWLDADKRVFHIEASVSPDTYPTIFDAGHPCQYIIELSAGQAAQAGIHTGEVLQFV